MYIYIYIHDISISIHKKSRSFHPNPPKNDHWVPPLDPWDDQTPAHYAGAKGLWMAHGSVFSIRQDDFSEKKKLWFMVDISWYIIVYHDIYIYIYHYMSWYITIYHVICHDTSIVHDLSMVVNQLGTSGS